MLLITFLNIQVVFIENEQLKREVQRLKWDNAQLIKKTKHANAEKDTLLVRLLYFYAQYLISKE